MWLVRILFFILYYGQTHTLETQYKTQNKYFSADFCKWPNIWSWGSVRIFLRGYLFVWLQYLVSKEEFLFFKFPKRLSELSWAKTSPFLHFIHLYWHPNLKTWLSTHRCPFPLHSQGWMPCKLSQQFSHLPILVQYPVMVICSIQDYPVDMPEISSSDRTKCILAGTPTWVHTLSR